MKINREIPARQVRLLIFDLDGTLVDSRQDLGNSINAMLRHFGRHELPLEVIASYIGDGAPMLVRRALGDPSSTIPMSMMESSTRSKLSAQLPRCPAKWPC